jgi:membrane-associated phospholipid phosphatase
MSATPPSTGSARATPLTALERFDRLDRHVSRRIAVGLPRPRLFRLPLSALSLTANYGILWYGLALLPWLFAQPRPFSRALYVVVPVTLVEFTGYLIKLRVARPRPPIADPDLLEQIPLPRTHSFPSSHASMSVVGALTLGAMYPQALPVLVALVVVLCFSRVYLGVHYAGDVLGGMIYGLAVGSAWVLLVAPPA